MAKVIVRYETDAWLANYKTLITALDRLGWVETRVAGCDARIEPEHHDGSTSPYERLCEMVSLAVGEAADADWEFVWTPTEDAWVWHVIVPSYAREDE